MGEKQRQDTKEQKRILSLPRVKTSEEKMNKKKNVDVRSCRTQGRRERETQRGKGVAVEV